MSKANKEEKPTPLGARVYKKHRKMLSQIRRKTGDTNAEIVRMGIEAMYATLSV